MCKIWRFSAQGQNFASPCLMPNEMKCNQSHRSVLPWPVEYIVLVFQISTEQLHWLGCEQMPWARSFHLQSLWISLPKFYNLSTAIKSNGPICMSTCGGKSWRFEQALRHSVWRLARPGKTAENWKRPIPGNRYDTCFGGFFILCIYHCYYLPFTIGYFAHHKRLL